MGIGFLIYSLVLYPALACERGACIRIHCLPGSPVGYYCDIMIYCTVLYATVSSTVQLHSLGRGFKPLPQVVEEVKDLTAGELRESISST